MKMNWYKKAQSKEFQPLVNEAKKYKNAEEFKVRGFEEMQRIFFGFQTNDIITLSPEKIKIVWKPDYQDAMEGERAVGITEQTPPVEVAFNINTGEYFLNDGHARYVSALRDGVPLQAKIEWTHGNYEDMAKIFLSKTGLTVEEFYRRIMGETSVKEIMKKWKSAGVYLEIFENDKTITLSNIAVSKELRKQGIGSQIMTDLINYADRVRKRIELYTEQKNDYNGTTSESRLIKFYKRFGFVENKGRNKDYTTTRNMYREPQ
jgi:ribosomal protein S18 acetylase RimI-like enzyme